LPEFTEAVVCIEAGITAPVITGEDSVVFQAGSYIELGPNFETNGPFEAIIATATCIDDCANCCEDWTGFTYDEPIPNIFTPNGDGINDIWFINDSQSNYCAFNALGYEISVVNRWGNTVYHKLDLPGYCCPYQGANAETGLEYTEIHWDGKKNNGEMVNDGTYFIKVRLIGCDYDEHIQATVALVGSTNFTTNNNDSVFGYLSNEMALIPNPTSLNTTLYINQPEGTYKVNVYNVQGQLIKSMTTSRQKTNLDVEKLSKGLYLVQVSNGFDLSTTKLLIE
jgi:flagellar hook assembly protein FlgD